MNNKKQVDSTQDKPGVESVPETKAKRKAEAKVTSDSQKTTGKTSTGRGWRLLAIFLLLVIIAGGGALGWFGQSRQNKNGCLQLLMTSFKPYEKSSRTN